MIRLGFCRYRFGIGLFKDVWNEEKGCANIHKEGIS